MPKWIIVKLILVLSVFASISFAADVTAFVSPDGSYAALRDFLADAGELKIAVYTFTSNDIADLLRANATILVDASPVGGLPQQSKAIFCQLIARGMRIYLYAGPLRFMHAKYIIKDGKHALIASENLGDDGFPKNPDHGNRGWGVIVEDDGIVKELSDIFLSDLMDSKPFICDGNYSINKENVAGNYNPNFKQERFVNQNVSLITAPVLSPLLDLIASAKRRILVEQFYIHRYFDRKSKAENPLLEALINAAKRGINVSVLLDSVYYNVERDDPSSNLYTAEYINDMGKAMPIEARLIDLSNGLLKLHNKGMIADDVALISSINWNENSPTRNREVGIAIKGEAANYFASVFNSDFHPENRITGFATARNFIGLGLVILIIIFFVWIRRRAQNP